MGPWPDLKGRLIGDHHHTDNGQCQYAGVRTLCRLDHRSAASADWPEWHVVKMMGRMQSLTKTVLGWVLGALVNTLLNLMDAATYGGLLFPVQAPLFAGYGFLGVSMYLLCTTVSQLVVSLFSSFRRGATACATVETIPFYHSISFAVANRVIDSPVSMISTILAAYALIAVTTGLIFLTLAMLNLDRLVHKFPRVVLVGSMGGIGVFLVQVGLEMAARESLTLASLGRLFASWVTVGLWVPAMAAAVASLMAELRWRVPFVTSIAAGGLFLGFYLVALLVPYSLDQLRDLGWLMSGPEIDSGGPLEVYKIFSPAAINWTVLIRVLPTVVGAALFGSMHVPINVPSFARLTNQAFSMRRELFTQAFSNWLSAGLGFIPNYFVYTNSLLFYRAGGRHRVAGLLLAFCTGCVLWRGLHVLNYVPTLIALYLLFYLGASLLWEALTSFHLCSLQEYCIVWLTMTAMSVTGFLPGILVGIFLAGIHSWYYVKIHPRRLEIAPRSRTIVSPADEWLAAQIKGHCLVVSLEGSIYFANSVEELLKLTFTSLECSVVLVDLGRVSFVDLNAREAFLAIFTSGLLGDLRLICLGVEDERLRRGLDRYAHITVSDEDVPTWYRRLAMERLGRDQMATPPKGPAGDNDEEEARLLAETPLSTDGLLALEDGLRAEYERLQGLQSQLMALLSDRTRHLVVPEGGTLTALGEIPGEAGGVFVVARGRIRQRSGRYCEGAWIGLEDYVTGETGGLSEAAALCESAGAYIPREALDDLPPDAREALLQLSRILLEQGY